MSTLAAHEEDILDDIDGHMHGPMAGFIDKFFGDVRHVLRDDGALDLYTDDNLICSCLIPSSALSPDDFLKWVSNDINGQSDGARGLWRALANDAPLEGTDDENGVRLVLTMPATLSTPFGWQQVQVAGHVYKSPHTSYRDGLLGLCDSARQVFSSQPGRLLLHGFYVRGSLVELWVFDRSGLYCSDVLDMRTDGARICSIILRYQRMDDRQLGNSNLKMVNNAGTYVELGRANSQLSPRIYLESRPIASHDALVGTGTTCYRARLPESEQWSHIFKIKWRWARDRPESELLNLAEQKGAWGAISLDYYEEFETTAELRRSLRWGPHSRFSAVKLPQKQEKCQSQIQEDGYIASGLIDHTEDTGNFFQNRILSCSLTSPVGRPLHTFQSRKELLEVLRDAVKCHRSLYFDVGVLHQDVSPGNVVILDGQGKAQPKGVLIDLDSAIELDQEGDLESGTTGTRPFMGIGVLRGERHTYRHDLESFLYVFLWTVISGHHESPPETSKLRQWSSGDWDELVACKCRDMGRQGFPVILGEFTMEFQSLTPLAEALHRILFPLRNGAVWTGTDSSPETATMRYDAVIHALEEAIVANDVESPP